MKTKKLISVVLALTMICSMSMSAVPVSAADGEHTHAICGETTCTTDHNLDGSADGVEVVEYTALSEALKAAGAYDEATDTYKGCGEQTEYDDMGYSWIEYYQILESGNYYLDKNIDLSSTLYIGGNVNLCLNGHKLAMADGASGNVIYNDESATALNLADCNGAGGSFRFRQDTDQWIYDEAGEHTVEGGVITGGNYKSNTIGQTGCGIELMYNDEIAFNMYGGNVVGNNAGEYNGGGLSIAGVMNLYDGTIQGNYAGQFGGGICSNGYGSTIYGGLIAYNKNPSSEQAAGLHADEKLTMLGGEIKNNFGNGVTGRKWEGDDNGFYMMGGNITGNTGYGITNGIWVADSPLITLGGDADKIFQIVNNGSGNVNVNDGYTIAVNDLAEDSVIGISTETAPTAETPVTISETGAAYAANFTSDNAAYKVAASGEGLVLKVKDTTPRAVTISEEIANGSVESDKETAMKDEVVTLTVTPAAGYAVESVTVTDAESNVTNATVDVEDITKYTFTMPVSEAIVSATFKAIDYNVNISTSFVGGTVTPDKATANIGDTVTLTVQPVLGYSFTSLTVKDAEGNEVETSEAATTLALDAPTTLTFTMPASSVTVDAVFTMKSITGVFTVEAVVSDTTPVADRDENDEGMDVYSGDKVYIDVVVNGADYTNASWTLVYDSSKFKYVGTAQNVDYGTLGYYTLDDSNADGNVLTGKISGVAGNDKKTDEFTGGEAVVTYEFEALPQSKAVTGKFAITSAYANTYEMAGIQNDTPAATDSTEVSIVLVEDTDNSDETTPAGTFEDKTVTYNALEQSGNEFVLDTDFADATVTYYATEDGSPVADSNDDGRIDATELGGLTFRTGLPAWTNVGSYTYYAKVSGDGLATIYDSATLTIEPATLTPSANFAVDPDVNKVTIIPVLEGVVDGSHTGTVTVKYTNASGDEETQTLNASDFKYDGESTSVYTGAAIEVKAQASGTFTVTLNYEEGDADNYTGDENTATVDVDKITFADTAALEAAITSVFPYDSTDHKVVVDEAALAEITDGTWTATTIVDAYDETISDPTVKNAGDERLVKVVFTDSTGVYNDVVVYVILKVTPADVRITIDNKTKAVGEDDPEFTYTLEVLDEDGNVVKTNELYSADDLTALALELTREPGEAAGTYTITATYVPNANYNVAIENGKLEIGAPSTSGENPQVKIEVVDLSKGLTNGDVQPDYIADKRLILVYTELDKAYYGYGDDEATAERMFDVTEAGYKYVDNNYAAGTYTEDATEYKHVYGIVVDKIDTYVATEEYEKQYFDKVIFLGSDAKDAPENIVYDANINLTNELDINDYSMNNGIYNNGYDRATYIRSILKADYNHDKVVNTDDSLAVKGVVDPAVAAR